MLALRSTFTRTLVVAVVGLFLAAGHAEARAGRGGRLRQPRRAHLPGAPADPHRAHAGAADPALDHAAAGPGGNQTAPRPGWRSRRAPASSHRGGFFGGLLGAGLLGMLLGYGMFGGLGGLGSILGLLLQVALVVILVRLAIRLFQRRNQPAYAAPGRRPARPCGAMRRPGLHAGRRCSVPGAAKGREQVPIGQADLDRFERTLGEVQTAYGARDLTTLDRLATPEVVGFLAEELGQDERRGVKPYRRRQAAAGRRRRVLARAGQDYATVAMRLGLRDWTTDSATGRVVEGDPDRPTEATELWTFVRPRGGEWLLSAIQQA